MSRQAGTGNTRAQHRLQLSKLYLYFRLCIQVFETRHQVFFIADGTVIYDESGENVVGRITSGIPSPTLKKNVLMGYVMSRFAKQGTEVKLDVRKKKIDARVTKMPFVPTNYFTAK